MRLTSLIGLIVFTGAAAIAAEKPIPQDLAAMEKRARDRLEWNLRTTVGAYEKIGKKDPRWDRPAAEAIALNARMSSERGAPLITQEQIYKATKAAVDAGCDDPLVVNMFCRTSPEPANKADQEELAGRRKAAAEGYAKSRYPAFRRATFLGWTGELAVLGKEDDPAARREAGLIFDAVLALLPVSVADDDHNPFWEERWFETINRLITCYRAIGIEATDALAKVDAELAKFPALAVVRLEIRGVFWMTYAWEARTKAFAPMVPEGAMTKFQERLALSQRAFEEAWKLRPGTPRAATCMVNVEKGLGGDREAMELWFDRAMKADGDRYNACISKLDFLDPKWHGSKEEMVAFGRACRDTKNWKAAIILLLPEAHHRATAGLSVKQRVDYLNADGTWAEIRAVFEEYLSHYPDDDVVRSKYAALCWGSDHLPEAHAQFEILGDRLTSWSGTHWVPLESLKQMKTLSAKAVARKNAEAGKKGVLPKP